MKRLYRAADLFEATLLRDLLTQARIESVVFNEHAQSGAGQLPLTETWPEVWVRHDRDLNAAEAIVVQFEARGGEADLERRCLACAEANPAGFEICWSCGTPF